MTLEKKSDECEGTTHLATWEEEHSRQREENMQRIPWECEQQGGWREMGKDKRVGQVGGGQIL